MDSVVPLSPQPFSPPEQLACPASVSSCLCRQLGRTSAVRHALFILAVAWFSAGCADDDRPFNGECRADAHCSADSKCLDGVCAETFEDAGGEAEPAGDRVRVFAVGWKPLLEEAASLETFDRAIDELVEREVAPHLAIDRANLLVFPENTGLVAAFVGDRNAVARAQPGSLQALLAVGESWSDAVARYAGRSPLELSQPRLITLAWTDTQWRTLRQTFARIAGELGVWIAVTYDTALAERSTDPADIATFVDPTTPDRQYAWVAVSDEVYNQTLLFDPEGELTARWAKEYLVPLEEIALDLSYGRNGGLRARTLPFGPVASVISKDAWMPDVLDRLALDGVRLMLQPEAFTGWVTPDLPNDEWGPDVVKEGGWGHVMRYPEFRANVLACMSANLIDLAFDCQSAILSDPHLSAEADSFVGQDPDTGFARVAPWAIEDEPGDVGERRRRLTDFSARLVPGSGDPLENGYRAGTVWLDLDLSAGFPIASEPAALLAPSDSGEQRRPAIVTVPGGEAFTAWEDSRRGPARFYGARMAVDRQENGAARVRADIEGAIRAPRLAAGGDRIHAVWQEANGDAWRVRYASSDDGGRSFSEPLLLSGDGDAYVPSIAVDSAGTAHVVWVERHSGPARIWYSRRAAGPAGFAEAAPLEALPEGDYDPRQNQWSPAVAARAGTVAVLWTDFRSFSWQIRGAFSRDGGATFGDVFRVDDATEVPWETIHSEPRAVFNGDGAVVAVWTDLRVRREDYDVRARRFDPEDIAAAAPSIRLAATDTDQRPQWRPAVAALDDRIVAVWQDFRTGLNELRWTHSSDGGRTFAPDTPLHTGSGGEAFNPDVALTGDRIVFAYESTSSGERRVAVAIRQ